MGFFFFLEIVLFQTFYSFLFFSLGLFYSLVLYCFSLDKKFFSWFSVGFTVLFLCFFSRVI